MKIIDSYQHPDSEINTDPAVLTNLVNLNHQPVVPKVLDYVKTLLQQPVLVIHSGSWNLDIDAIYLEPVHHRPLHLDFHKNTKFIDHPFDPKIKKLLGQNPVNQVLFLHSPLTKYLTIQELTDFLDGFKYLTANRGTIIAVVNLLFLNFNRLNNTYRTMFDQLNATKIENDLIVCR